MTVPVRDTVPVWQPRRVALFAMAVMAGCYLVVFIADGARPGFSVLRNAVANTLAAATAAVPVWMMCTRVPWRLGNRWWFLPVHSVVAVGFVLLWYVVVALVLGLAAMISSGRWAPAFLTGPAMHWQAMTGVVLYCAIAAACYVLQATRDAQQAAALLHSAQVSALRAQLDPHLLFNTLHSLLELVRSGDTRAEDAIDRFAKVARYVTEGRTPDRDRVPLHAEWHMVQDYVALESLRLGERLVCRFEFGDNLEAVTIPALSLQPLVENAIRHGIAPRPGPGSITVSATRTDDQIDLQVVDDGQGAAAKTRGAGTGLELVRRRMQAHYGDALRFTAGPRGDAIGWAVRATFPAQVEA